MKEQAVPARRVVKRTGFDTDFSQRSCEIVEQDGPVAVVQSESDRHYSMSVTQLKETGADIPFLTAQTQSNSSSLFQIIERAQSLY